MLAFRLVPALFIAAILLVGCRTSTPIVDDDEAGNISESDSSVVHTRAVHVLVDGKDLGVIPMTVRVRRGFGTRQVSLWQAGEEIRTYEFEIVHTSSGMQLQQGFWSNSSPDGETYDVRNLPTSNDSTFLVPYSNHPIKIEDQTFGVTLLVSE